MTPHRKANHIPFHVCFLPALGPGIPALRPDGERRTADTSVSRRNLQYPTFYGEHRVPLRNTPSVDLNQLVVARPKIACQRTSSRRFACARRDRSKFLTSVLVLSGDVSCVQYSADRSRARGRSTGILCAMFRRRNILNKNNAPHRTEMPGLSTVAAYISATWPAWRGRKRPKATSHSSPASMREQRAAGLPTTTNHQPKCSASFSRRS